MRGALSSLVLLAATGSAAVACTDLLGIADGTVVAGTGRDGAAADGPATDSGVATVTPPSCANGGPGSSSCGSRGTSCCASVGVPGGTFDRSYDGLSTAEGYTSTASPSTVSAFRLDQYEVTVGRFRQFVSAVEGGWQPTPGFGKHTHLNGGQGLNETAGGYEGGWDMSWTANLVTTASDSNNTLAGGTWTASAGSNENLPITRVDWYEAYAFCIWDGGFLPSEAEWNFAAAGGGEQRAYPWSPPYPPGSTSTSCTNANYLGCPAGWAIPVGGDSPAGDGKWGHADLAGNVWEWTLDQFASYVTPCLDCTNLAANSANTAHVFRGGGFSADVTNQLASTRSYQQPTFQLPDLGLRCARTL